MKYIDWHMVLFVGTSLVHDYWIHWGLPQVYYWDVKRRNLKINKDDDENKVA